MCKRFIVGALLIMSGLLARAEEAPRHNPVMLAKVGELDAALMDRLKNWVESQLAIPLPLAESLATSSTKLDEVAAAAAESLTAEDLGVVVLVAQSDTAEPNGIYRPEQRVVVINVADMREGSDDEKFARRLERQVIRGVGVLMGLTWSPNPESAMAFYTTMEELDQMGRNLDPPWLLKLQERARELGVPLDPENPANFFPE